MTRISDLPEELVEAKIFPKVPITSLRSTCKKWNVQSKKKLFAQQVSKQAFLGLMVIGSRVCFLKFNLQEIRLVGPSIKQVSILDRVDISNVFYCDGLLLCVVEHKSRLLLWNPYLGQTTWLQPRKNNHKNYIYALGYDNNRNHKILRVLVNDIYCLSYEIYDLSSNSWNILDVNSDWDLYSHKRGIVSLKGNTYFLAQDDRKNTEIFLLCFDYTRDSFGPRLPLPFHIGEKVTVTLSCVREEQLAVLYRSWLKSETIEIWITTNIEPNAVSWKYFLKVDMTMLNGLPSNFDVGSFFIDEEKKVAVVFRVDGYLPTVTCHYDRAYIIGEDGFLETVNIKEARNYCGEYGSTKHRLCLPLVSFSYVPSLVQLQIKQHNKRKERDYY